MKSKTIEIVVPIYREYTLSDTISLDRLFSLCSKNYNIVAVCPESLDMDMKYEFSHIERFHDEYFKSTAAYSSLLESFSFWSIFSSYDYILIHQTDCFLLYDKIDQWTSMGYDYIGAPIISTDARWKNAPCVGNGGLSLRNTSKFLSMVSGPVFEKHEAELMESPAREYEDLYFLQTCNKYFKLDIPTVKLATLFACDMNPDKLLGDTPRIMPMGIHAFDKNIPYWSKIVPELSSKELYDECYLRHKNYIDLYYGSKLS